MVIKTCVNAESLQQAYFLLQGLYGQDAVVHQPTEVR